MLIKDEGLQVRHQTVDSQESRKAALLKWAEEQQDNLVVVEDGKLETPANVERQLGRLMTSAELESRLKKICPRLHFEHDSIWPGYKRMYVIEDNQKHEILKYHAGFLPEHSIMAVKEQELPNPDVIRHSPTGALAHINRKDLQNGTALKKVKVLWRESVRGWRTIIIRLVLAGVITIGDAEKFFGSCDRPEWAGKLGKQNINTPW